jgi:hypothetical protein
MDRQSLYRAAVGGYMIAWISMVEHQQLHPSLVLVLAATAGADNEIFPGIATPGWFGTPFGAAADHNSGVSIIFELGRLHKCMPQSASDKVFTFSTKSPKTS